MLFLLIFENMSDRKKIIVTGGAGFIGSHSSVELYNAGYLPVIVDNFSNSESFIVDHISELCGENVPFYEVDCSDINGFAEVFDIEKPQGVIHFAAYKAVGESVENPLRYYQNNLGSLLVLLELMKEFQVSDLVFSSSCTVYGQPDKIPVTESAAANVALSPYGNTKVISEQMIRDCVRSGMNLHSVLLRYFNPIGAHPSGLLGELPRGIPNNLVPYITQTAAGIREKITVNGTDYNTPDGTCIRDYIHVVDLAKAHVAAMKYIEQQSQESCSKVFNLGTGKGASVLEVIQEFERVNNVKVNYHTGPRRAGDVEQIYAATDLAAKELGWKTELSLGDALRDAWNWEKKLHEA